MTGHITENDDTHFQQEIDSFVQWCDQNYLELNVFKTKKMLTDFRRKITMPHFVVREVEVEILETCTYLADVFDDGLSWKEKSVTIVKKAHIRIIV